MDELQDLFKVTLTNLDTSYTIIAEADAINLFSTNLVIRRTNTHGITFLFNSPISFAFNAKNFVQAAYNELGADARVKLDLFIRKGDIYLLLTSQFLDFSTFIQQDKRRSYPSFSNKTPNFITVECELVPVGIEQKVLDRWGDSFTMAQTLSTERNTLSEKDKKQILLLSKPFQTQSKALLRSGTYKREAYNDGTLPINFLVVPAEVAVQELENTKIEVLSGFWTRIQFSSSNALTVTQKITLDFSYSVDLDSNPDNLPDTDPDYREISFASVQIVSESTIFYQKIINSALTTKLSISDNVKLDFSTQLNLAANEKVRIEFFLEHDATGSADPFVINPEVKATINTTINNITVAYVIDQTASNSIINAYLIYEVLQQGIEIASDLNDSLISTLYGRQDNNYPQNGRASLRMLANGEEIRQVNNPKPFQTSLSKLFSDLDAIDCLGLDFKDEKVRIEQREKFYIDEVFWQFNDIPEINKQFADVTVFRNIEGGYEIFLREDEFSLNDETNQNRNWNSANRNIRTIKTDGTVRKYNSKVKTLCASSWAREKQRREPLDDKKKDFDDINFIECLVLDGSNYKTETDENFYDIANVYSPSRFPNLRITPLRNLHRHLRFLFQIFWKRPLRYILTGWDGNVLAQQATNDASEVVVGKVIAENTDVTSDLANAIHEPQIVTFTASLDLNFLFELQKDENRYKLIQVSDADDNYETGWLYEDGINIDFSPIDGFMMNFRLLVKETNIQNPVSPPPPPVDEPEPPFKEIGCGETALSGGKGITELNFNLNPNGGILIIDCQAYSVIDKFEIIHDEIKKATTSMASGDTNYGSFDPADDESSAGLVGTTWYIGSSIGTVPTRITEFQNLEPTLSTLPLSPNTQQRLWWRYTSADYQIATVATVRVTGTGGTAWVFTRVCEPETSSSPCGDDSFAVEAVNGDLEIALYNLDGVNIVCKKIKEI